MKYQYKCITAYSSSGLTELLNVDAERGWKLISVCYTPEKFVAWLEKPSKED